jgi:hypothetical protein
MSIAELGALGEFVGAIGVIGTLAYLAVQIRQNTRSVQASAFHDFLDNWRRTAIRDTLNDPELNDLHIRGMADFDDLDDREKARWHLYIIQFTSQAQIAMELYDRGFLPESECNLWVDFVTSVLRTPGGLKLWEQTKHILSERLIDTLSRRLEETRGEPSYLESIPFLASQSR